MTRRFGIIALAVIVSASIAGGMVDLWQQRSTGSKGRGGPADSYEVREDYREALQVIGGQYAGSIDYEKATQVAIQGMLSTLDPHSIYFPRAEYTKLKEDQDSRLTGIGVTILRHRDGVYIQSAVPNTPAARAGLRYGDRIVEVDGKDARDWSSEQVSKNVRGEEGEPVTIKIERAGAQPALTYTITRASVSLPSIRNAYMLRPGVGYIGMTAGFQHTTGEELNEAIRKLKAQGMKQVVLDLRGNPGGLLDQAIEVASDFIPRGQPIVSVRGRVEYKEPYVYASTGTDPEDFPLVVLINHNSASASEIVAGAIQDHGRGLIVGQTSFGKGLVQRIYPILYGTGLTLTTARYYTPYGRSLQRDYSNGSLYDYYVRHDEDEELPPRAKPPAANTQGTDPASAQPTPQPTPPPPTGPAIKTAAGRVFYGGGGITPDIEVRPLQITALRGRLAEAAFYFTRELTMGQIPGLESYRVEKVVFNHPLHASDYPVTDRVVEAFKEFIQRDGHLGVEPAQVDGELEFVRLRLRQELITAAFGSDMGVRVLLEGDPQVMRAIEALPDARRLAELVRSSASHS